MVRAQKIPIGKTWHAAKVPAGVPAEEATAWVITRAAR